MNSLHQGVANYGSQAKLESPTVFISTVLLEHSHAH